MNRVEKAEPYSVYACIRNGFIIVGGVQVVVMDIQTAEAIEAKNEAKILQQVCVCVRVCRSIEPWD